MATEKEDLDQLIHTQGWLRVVQQAEAEWNAKFAQHVAGAAGDTDDVAAIHKLRQIIVAKTAIERMIGWPAERLAELERAEKSRETAMAEPLSRRGSL